MCWDLSNSTHRRTNASSKRFVVSAANVSVPQQLPPRNFQQTHRYYHRFPDDAPRWLLGEATVSVVRLRYLKYHVVNRQLFHVRVWLIRLHHRSRRHARYSVLCLVVVVVVLTVGVVVVVIVVVVAGGGVVVVIVATSRGRELLHVGGGGGRRGGRHCVFGAAFSRTFRHPAVPNG